MIRAGALVAAMLLLVGGDGVSAQPVADPAAVILFAPPVDRPLTYRVTTRRLDRDGTLVSFTLTYGLEWRRSGRGYQLEATLQPITSDARPAVRRALTGLLEPLVGQRVTLLVDGDGQTVSMVDPDQLWARVTTPIAAVADGAAVAEGRQMASILAALPPAERERLTTADLRGLIAPANRGVALAGGPGVTMTQSGPIRTITKAETQVPVVDGAQTHVETTLKIDTGTGLVLSERRQSWIGAPGDAGRVLIEERIRTLFLFE